MFTSLFFLQKDSFYPGCWPNIYACKTLSLFFACALFFLFRRIFSARVRAITSFSDYMMLCIATAPFVTGFFAYHQTFDYKLIVTLHMLTGELMLVAATFTKIFHMVFFFFGRFILVSERTLGKGSRRW